MKRFSSLLAVLGVLALAVASPSLANPGGVRRFTLEEAVAASISDNPDLAIAARSLGVADARVDAAKAQRLPSLMVEAGVQVWNDEGTAAFELPGMSIDFTTRDQVTGSATVTLAQPITAFFTVGKLIDVERTGRDAAVAQLDGARADVAAQTAELYLRIMQARAGVEIAASAVTQLDAQLTRAKALEAAGVLGRVDVMRIDSARAQAQQTELSAQESLARAEDALGLLLGLPPGTAIETVDDLPKALPPVPWDEARAIALAAQRRPELRTARVQARQATQAVGITRMDYWPQLAAVAQYQRTEGQALAIKDQAFVGLSLRWNVWDWGKRGADVDQAERRAAQARAAADRAVDGATLDVRQKLRAAETRRKQLAVAEQGLATAEEAYKLITVRFQGGDATTTDQIDAEADVTRARLAFANARYEYAIALVQLARAVGEPPLAALSPQAAAAGAQTR